MILPKRLGLFCLYIFCFFCLTACASSPALPELQDGVQDIEPGGDSVIQPPAHREQPQSKLEERSL